MTPRPPDLSLLATTPRPNGHLGAHHLARYAADELPPAERAAAAAHLASCATCQAHLDADETARHAFLARRPTPVFLAALAAREAAPAPRADAAAHAAGAALAAREAPRPSETPRVSWGSRPRWPAALAGALAMAAAAVLVARLLPGDTDPTPTGATTRLKAAVDLSFHVRSGAAVTLGRPGAVVHPGDAIQLRYSSPRPTHLVVVSLDSAGAVTPFYDDAGRALSLDPGVAVLLDGSVVLDHALGPERVIGCFSPTPIATAAVVAAAEQALRDAAGDPAAATRLPLPCAQATFLLHKQAP